MRGEGDFAVRRSHLAGLSDSELEERFWDLAEKVVNPWLEIAQNHTTPSIERSVLMRMGFNSLQAKNIVEKCIQQGLLGKGAGHVVWKMAQLKGASIREAGEMLLEDEEWALIKNSY